MNNTNKEILKINDGFYPTPDFLIEKMVEKVDWQCVNYILEPSAGKGNIIQFLEDKKDASRYSWRYKGDYDIKKIISYDKIYAIEKEIILRECFLYKFEDVTVIDSDFLMYSGTHQIDLIIMNPPFSEGVYHLLKAIHVLYSGQIVCLLNAETIKNPYSKERKELVEQLNKLQADIEYISGAFEYAERKTKVEIALIYIDKRKNLEDDFVLYELEEEIKQNNIEKNIEKNINKEENQIMRKDEIHNIVVEYNKKRDYLQRVIMEYYQRYKIINSYLSLQIKGEKTKTLSYDDINKTGKEFILSEMRNMLNEIQQELKQEYWNKVLELDCLYKYVCSNDKKEIQYRFDRLKEMEVNENNIRQFIVNIINHYPQIVKKNIVKMFQSLTKYALNDRYRDRQEYLKSIHYFNGWKTNKAYKINKKVIIPMYLYDSSWGKMELNWYQHERYFNLFNDLEKVLMFVSGIDIPQYSGAAMKISEIIKQGRTKNIETYFFYVTVYKKGTCHITFKDEDVLRKFNIEACKGLGFLPDNYADREYDDLSVEEQAIVEEFEGVKNYKVIKEKSKFLLSGKLNKLNSLKLISA